MSEGKNLVGVDIGSSSIKVCEVKETRKGRTLFKVAYAPLPPQTIVDGHVMNTGVVTETLSQIFSQNTNTISLNWLLQVTVCNCS